MRTTPLHAVLWLASLVVVVSCQAPGTRRGETELEGNQYDLSKFAMPNNWDFPASENADAAPRLGVSIIFNHPVGSSLTTAQKDAIENATKGVFVRALQEQCSRFRVTPLSSKGIAEQLDAGRSIDLDVEARNCAMILDIEVDVRDQIAGNKINEVEKIQRSIGLTLIKMTRNSPEVVASKNYIGVPVYRRTKVLGGEFVQDRTYADKNGMSNEEVMSATANAYRAAQFLNQTVPVNVRVKSLDMTDMSASVATSSNVVRQISAQQAFVLWAWETRRQAAYPLAFCKDVQKGGGSSGTSKLSLDKINHNGRASDIWRWLDSRKDRDGFFDPKSAGEYELYATSFGVFIAESVEARKFFDSVREKALQVAAQVPGLEPDMKLFEY
jgi:hypothetical protein